MKVPSIDRRLGIALVAALAVVAVVAVLAVVAVVRAGDDGPSERAGGRRSNEPDASAGYADVECRQRCAGNLILVTQSGEYRIRVQATDGPWAVQVQEYRR